MKSSALAPEPYINLPSSLPNKKVRPEEGGKNKKHFSPSSNYP